MLEDNSGIGISLNSWRKAFSEVMSSALFRFLAAATVATLVFFLRAPAAFMIPDFFAEDGAWTSMVYLNGFWHTAFHSRGDYPVFGNILLIWTGMKWAGLWFQGDVFMLPKCYAVISYLFYGATVSLPFLYLKKQFSFPELIVFWMLACFMPLGVPDTPSGFEIFGRIVNVGFAFLFIAFLLIWYRNVNADKPVSFFITDTLLFICAATNPLCLAMLPAILWPYLKRFIRNPRELSRSFRDPGFLSLYLLAAACILWIGIPSPEKPGEAVPLSLTPELAIRMGIARSMLYAIIWPVYKMLSIGGVLLILVLTIMLVLIIGRKRNMGFYSSVMMVLLLVSATIVLFRPSLRPFFQNFNSPFPDRYFYGQHLIVLLFMVRFGADIGDSLKRIPGGSVMVWIILIGFAVFSAYSEKVWKAGPSQYQLIQQGSLHQRVSVALREKRFVNRVNKPDQAGKYLLVEGNCSAPILLPRNKLEAFINK